MIVSVGQLYSSARLLELVAFAPMTAAAIRDAGGTVLVAPMAEILNLCTRCGWLELDGDGALRNSSRGESLRALTDYQERLRQQLRDVVTTLQPAWSKTLIHGRREFSRYAPPDVVQCFRDAGLLDALLSDFVVKWWDELAQLARGLRSATLSEVGRRAERLTRAYEFHRTGREAFWQSVESSFSGYDVLSVIASEDLTPLQIEVKASELRLKEAWFYLTANEWKSAQQARAHCFHLWQFGRISQLAIVAVDQVQSHVPTNCGDGVWESVKIPFRAFAPLFRQMSP